MVHGSIPNELAALLLLGFVGCGQLAAATASPHSLCSSSAATCSDPGTHFSLLQRNSTKLDKALPAERLAALRPIAWMHIPKTGGSFLNFLIHLPGNCPGVPANFVDLHQVHKPAGFNDKYKMFEDDGGCPGTFARPQEAW